MKLMFIILLLFSAVISTKIEISIPFIEEDRYVVSHKYLYHNLSNHFSRNFKFVFGNTNNSFICFLTARKKIESKCLIFHLDKSLEPFCQENGYYYGHVYNSITKSIFI